MSYNERWVDCPNRGGKMRDAKGFCFHHSDGGLASNIDWLGRRSTRASYHCIIAPDGERVRLVDDRYRAWHAGYGRILGENPNRILVSIAFTGSTASGKYRPQRALTRDEVCSAFEFMSKRVGPGKLIESLDWKYITHHRAVDPGRRDDLPRDIWTDLISDLKQKFADRG